MCQRPAIRSIFPVCLLASSWVVHFPQIVSADIVIQNNGKIVVGRAAQVDQPEIHIVTGTPQGPRDVSIPRANVSRLLKGADEARRIDNGSDAAVLAQWTAAYYFAGLESTASRCLERALTLDPTIGAKPKSPAPQASAPTAAFVRFWNRTVLRSMTALIRKADTRRLLDIAHWTRAAGMNDASAYYLRRAWASSPSDAPIKQLATEWNVAIESWIQLDLTPALDEPLVADELFDENDRVRAEPGKIFLTLPVRYEVPFAAGGPKESASTAPFISRASLRGKDVRGFYGLRITPMQDGRIQLKNPEHDPIYERLEFLTAEDKTGLVVLRNKLGPRRIADDDKQKKGKPRQAKLRDEPLTIRSTGAAALILEIPNTTDPVSFEWADGGQESINVGFLREARETATDKIRTAPYGDDNNSAWAAIPTIAKSLAFIGGPSPAMAALAIERLARIRNRLIDSLGKNAEDDEAVTSWTADVDSAVLAAANRDEERVRVAAWRYFCTHPADRKPLPISSEALDLFADAPAPIQSRWVQILACGLRFDDCGLWWRQIGGVDPPGPDQPPLDKDSPIVHRPTAIAILGALLRSEDSGVASDAMDVLFNLQPPVTDWSFLEEASIPAQRAALARVDRIADKKAAAQLVQALIAAAKPETAADIAGAARIIGSTSDDPNDILLSQWWSLHPPSRKPAFLAALTGIELGESVYSPRFAEIIKDATAAEGPLRDAAFRLLIAQLRLRRDNVEIGAWTGATPAPTSRPSLAPGPFPLIIARSANDPITRGVVAAAREAKPPVRTEALKALIESGYAEQAAVCIMESESDDKARNALLTDLITLAATGHRDSVMALLGALLNNKGTESAPDILDHLSRLFAEVDPREHWRVLAAVKAGANLSELDEIAPQLGPATTLALMRWIHALGHMSTQDRQRLAATNDPAERAQRLQRISFHRGQLVDGRYGVLAILSTTRRLEPRSDAPDAPPRWNLPKRITLPLDPIVLEARAEQDSYTIRWNNRPIGEGLILQQPQPIRGPAAYLPAIDTAGPWGPPAAPGAAHPAPRHGSPDAAPDTVPVADDRPVGPLILPDRSQLERLAPGTMTLDLTAYLQEAIQRQHVFADEDVTGFVPDGYKITLRYGAFGSFYGCAWRRSPWKSNNASGEPPSRPIGSHFLLNVMLVVERMD